MIGLILILLSWGLLRFEGRSLKALGFNKPKQRSIELLAGLLLASLTVAVQMGLTAHFSGFSWEINPHFKFTMLLESMRWNLNSVLFEELIFRGYLLLLAIRFFGTSKGCLISGLAFGIYHWFSYNVFGDPVIMIYVLLLTGAMGWMLAQGFARSGSVILPIALHLGWNFTTITIFSNGPLGVQWLLPDSSQLQLMTGFQQFVISVAIPLMYIALVYTFLRFGRFYPSGCKTYADDSN